MKKYYSIIVMGDSIAYGAADDEGGWAQRLRKYLESKENASSSYFLYNLGIGGNTSSDLKERFELETSKRAVEDVNIIIFEVGINDVSYSKKYKYFRVNKEKFRENIEWLIEKSREKFTKIIFLGLLPVNEKFTSPLPETYEEFGGLLLKNSNVQYYNSILRLICERQKTMFIDMFEEFRKVKYEKLLYDGVHPNTKGHELMFKIVKEYLVKNKLIKG